MPRIKGDMKGKTEYSGIFKGRVETAVDPLGIGRMKVRIPSLHGIDEAEIATEDLPWASYCSPTSSGYDHGSFIPAEKGDYVWVIFEGEDPDKPVVLGGSYGTGASKSKNYGDKGYEYTGPSGSNETPLESQDNKEPITKVVYKSPKGASIIITEKHKEEELAIVDRLGQCIIMKSPYGDGARRRKLRWDKKDGLEPNGTAEISIFDAYKQRITMTDTKIEIMGPEDEYGITIEDGKIKIKGDLVLEGKNHTIKGETVSSDDIIADGISVVNHTHTGVHGETSSSN